jgi:hypothetical protein
MDRSMESAIRVVWGDSSGAQFKPYRIYPKWLLEKSEAARAAMAALGGEYLHPKPNFESSIQKLAEIGDAVRLGMFDDCLPEDQELADQPKQWFHELLKDRQKLIAITVHADPILPIPWGLLHDGNFESSRDVYDGFWAIRHQVTALYNGMKPQQLKQPRAAETVRLLAALNQEVFESTHGRLGESQREFITNFLDRPVGRAFSTAGCRQRWQQVGSSDCIIYFFGHANGSEIRFSNTDKLTPGSFRSLFSHESRVVRQRTRPIYVLTFLNGCATVSGQDADSFLTATASPGFCGYIGAEAVVPDRFAMLFGQELLHGLINEGLPLGQAISLLWRKHRPMGLFYGCYAHPDFAITPIERALALPAEFAVANFHPTSSVPSGT